MTEFLTVHTIQSHLRVQKHLVLFSVTQWKETELGWNGETKMKKVFKADSLAGTPIRDA